MVKKGGPGVKLGQTPPAPGVTGQSDVCCVSLRSPSCDGRTAAGPLYWGSWGRSAGPVLPRCPPGMQGTVRGAAGTAASS